jgi:pyruvate,water dikinase
MYNISKMSKEDALILWLEEVNNADVGLVGGKNASLGEMYQELRPKGIRIPNGFVVTAKGYRYFVEKSGLNEVIKKKLSDLNTGDIKNLQKRGREIRKAFIKAPFPSDLSNQISLSYKKLSKEYKIREVDTAVRSSATAEDLPGASFAGEHETYLNVKGKKNILIAIRAAFASLFNDRAISFRVD